jgi:hypothetical protein
MSEEYTPVEFPKWVGSVIVQNAAEENAVLDALTGPAPVPEPVEMPVAEPEHEADPEI